MPRPLSELAELVSGEVRGHASLRVTGLNGLAEAGPTELSFFGSARYRAEFLSTRAGAVLVPPDAPARPGLTTVVVANPHLAFAKISAALHERARPCPGVRPGAHVHERARVHPDAAVLAGATVEVDAEVGARTVLYPGAYVGERARVGADCTLYPNVTVREGCQVGDRVILHAGSVIGADGFGFVLDLEVPEHFKVPQVGIVRVEDDVEIGACSCVDRATFGETVVGRGAKIDNLVQVAHNVRVGPMSILCAQAGVSGSAELGSGVVLAGQVGVVGHIRVGDMAKVGAQSGVAHSVPDGATVSGSPAFDHREWLKVSAALNRLPDLVKQVRSLQARVAELEGREGQLNGPREGKKP